MVEQTQAQRLWQSARDRLRNYGEFAIDGLTKLCNTETLCKAMGLTVEEFKKSITLKPTGITTSGPDWKSHEMVCPYCHYITSIFDPEPIDDIACPKCYSHAWTPMKE